jgi:hypothetical protein
MGGGPPAGGQMGGGPPSGGQMGGGPPAGGQMGGGPPAGGRMQMKQPSEEEIEKVARFTDGNWVLEVARMINPFYRSSQKEIDFESDPIIMADRGKECIGFPFLLRQGDSTVKGEVAVASNTAAPSKCTATVRPSNEKRRKIVVVILYTYKQEIGRVYPSLITLVETTKKGLFGLRKETISCRYKLSNFSDNSNE